MKTTTKKTFCPNCLKLVMGTEKLADEHITVSCPRCNEVFWTWNGTYWHQIRK
jgi:phage FluMu protein Com